MKFLKDNIKAKIIKGGIIVQSQMGDPNASIPTPQPYFSRPMFGALGAAIGGRERERYADPIFGWAVAALVFTLAGVFVALPFTFLAIGLALAAAGSAVFIYRRDGAIYPASALKMGLLAIPLILLSSAMVASQWDEFSHWLPSSRFLFESDAFPTAANPETGASFPAYPYGWPLMNYLSSRLAGRFVENTGGMFNVLLLLTFGLLIAKIIRRGLGDVAGRAPGWALIALGGLAVTLLNPTFVQKLVLTAYSDGPTAATVGFAGVLGWFMLDALAAGEKSRARRLALQMGLIMLVMINIRQANLVLFVMLTGGVAVAGWRDPTIRLAELARLLPLMIVPPLLIFLVWRFHVSSGLSGAEFTVGAVSEWLIGNIPEILARMLLILSKKGAYLVLALTAIGFGVAGFFRVRGSFDRLAIIVGAIFLGYNAFLLFTYVSVFGERDALRAVSLWRYNMHLGPLGVAFAAYGLALLWKKYRLSERLEGKRAERQQKQLSALASIPRVMSESDNLETVLTGIARTIASPLRPASLATFLMPGVPSTHDFNMSSIGHPKSLPSSRSFVPLVPGTNTQLSFMQTPC
ncbi:MAG: hypothetical protein IID54_06190 [Proteobacteria bacterium]|nr:hypothetical protein [Pseudomonadota bacterium]